MNDHGFKVRALRIRDSESNTIFMDAPDWIQHTAENTNDKGETIVKFPAIMLDSLAIGRMVTFSAEDAIQKFNLTQNMYLFNQQIES